MISLFLRHIIFELSIDKFFKTIEGNFKSASDIALGSKFRSITLDDYNITTGNTTKTTHLNCEITDVYTSTFLNKKITVFNFTTDSGDKIMSCSSSDIIFER